MPCRRATEDHAQKSYTRTHTPVKHSFTSTTSIRTIDRTTLLSNPETRPEYYSSDTLDNRRGDSIEPTHLASVSQSGEASRITSRPLMMNRITWVQQDMDSAVCQCSVVTASGRYATTHEVVA